MSEIVGACLSQFHDDANSFELLLAYSDGREVGHTVSRRVSQAIASELIACAGDEPGLTCPHIDTVLASGQVSEAVAAELSEIREINSQLRYGTWALKAALAAKDAEIERLRKALSDISGYDRNFYDNGRPGYEKIARAALNPEASNV